jgi:hypothetical protein
MRPEKKEAAPGYVRDAAKSVSHKPLFWLALILSGGLLGCSTAQNHPAGLPIGYHNAQYEFTFYLPRDWRGYSVLMDQWQGVTYLPDKDRDVVLARGPIIVLRNPRWKAPQPYQDIPVYVFTRRQWDDIHSGKYDAAGAGGAVFELWHNDEYVFGMHSRYNWHESKGWHEVENVVSRNRAAHPAPLRWLYYN